ncbi:MFS transporter [Streptomyces sp. SCSIO 30461]|uniref:MFS transporter n=1 Tax=Streptomyces sp. SCSIO 30461 TaxID=3118085 RepID=UPI0030D0AE06
MTEAVPLMTKHQKMTVAATGLGIFMVFIDVNIVNVALPSIQEAFKTGEEGLQWVVAGYSLGMVALLMSTASLGDRYGRRRGFLAGVVVFTVSSALCALTTSLTALTALRVIQGVGAAFVTSLSLALLSAAFPDPKGKTKAIAVWMAVGMVGASVAPTLGGVLVQFFDWGSVFTVNVPVGAAVAVLTWVYVMESRDPEAPRLDWPGQVTFIPAVALLAFAVIQAPRAGWTSAAIWAGLLGASACMGLFVHFERRAAVPLIDLSLFGDPVYRSALVVYFLVMSCFFGVLILMTQYLQNVQGFSPLLTGMLILPVPVAFGSASLLAGAAVARWGPRWPTLACLGAVTAGLLVTAAGLGSMLPVMLAGLALFGAGSGGCATPLLVLGMTHVPEHRAGMAAGLVNLQRSMGCIFGVAFLGSILAAWLSLSLPGSLTAEVPDRAVRRAVASAIIDGANPHAHPAFIGPGRPLAYLLPGQDRAIVRAADKDFIGGIRIALGTAVVLLAGAFALSWRRFPTSGQG